MNPHRLSSVALLSLLGGELLGGELLSPNTLPVIPADELLGGELLSPNTLPVIPADRQPWKRGHKTRRGASAQCPECKRNVSTKRGGICCNRMCDRFEKTAS